MEISENCCFIVLKYKGIQTIIAMLIDGKVTEYFVWQTISASLLTSKWKNTVSVTLANAVTTVKAECQSPKGC